MTTSKSHSSSASPAFPFMLPSPNDGETDAKQKQQEEDKQNCNKYVNSGLTRNVTVQFLMERLMNMGCAPPKGFISCIDCGDKQAGAGFGVVEETITNSKAGTIKNVGTAPWGVEKYDVSVSLRLEGPASRMVTKCGENGYARKENRDKIVDGVLNLRIGAATPYTVVSRQ